MGGIEELIRDSPGERSEFDARTGTTVERKAQILKIWKLSPWREGKSVGYGEGE